MNDKMHKVLEWGEGSKRKHPESDFVKIVRADEILTRLSAGMIRRREEAQISGVWKKNWKLKRKIILNGFYNANGTFENMCRVENYLEKNACAPVDMNTNRANWIWRLLIMLIIKKKMLERD